MSDNLCEKYKIDESSINNRLNFIQLTKDDAEFISKLIPWIQSKSKEIAEEFYNWQFSFPSTVNFFENMAKKKGVSIDTLRQVLTDAQVNYIVEVFRGSESYWGPSYFEKRLKVGKIHDQIDLPLKWYLGSYPLYFNLIRKHLKKDFWYKSSFRERVEDIVLKVFNLDTQAVGDSFCMSLVESLGLDVKEIECTPGTDITENITKVKDSVRTLLKQAEHMSYGVFKGEEMDKEIKGALGTAFSKMRSYFDLVLNQAEEIGKGNLASDILSQKVPGEFGESFESMTNNLESILRLVQSNVSDIKESSGNLNSISLSIRENVENTSNQASKVSVISEKVSHNVQTVASASDEMTSAIKEIARSVGEASKTASKAASMMEEATKRVEKLSINNEDIDKIIVVITNIAEQTNLLALNQEKDLLWLLTKLKS